MMNTVMQWASFETYITYLQPNNEENLSQSSVPGTKLHLLYGKWSNTQNEHITVLFVDRLYTAQRKLSHPLYLG
jgi:hypothetical protein